jgi:hypothetical protein
MNRAKYISSFLIGGDGANNAGEHYEKIIKILHGHPFEG